MYETGLCSNMCGRDFMLPSSIGCESKLNQHPLKFEIDISYNWIKPLVSIQWIGFAQDKNAIHAFISSVDYSLLPNTKKI